MEIYSIRGAITIEENTSENIIKNSEYLLKEIIKQNKIENENIINIIFSATKDIDKAYPAIATRNIGITDSSIMCLQEMNVEDSLPMCIRVMITAKLDLAKKDIKHIYLKNAKKLRPDLSIKGFSVAIDGPAGSGKSTVSKRIAKELNFIYVDTGAMFRTVALYCINKGIDCSNANMVANNIEYINIEIRFLDGIQQIYLNGENVTEKIRTQEVAKGSSLVAKIPCVREKLLKIQRDLAKDNNIIMDGRDVGTNVLKDANVKIYLDADVEERAKRRCKELLERDIIADYQQIKQSIEERDYQDKNRYIAPLKKAEDAIVINSTSLNIDEVANLIIKNIKENIK